jgi:hypothetical protein
MAPNSSRCSRPVSSALRASNWGHTPMSGRTRARPPAATRLSPHTRASPPSSGSAPMQQLMVVDLPAPLGPSRQKHSPGGMTKGGKAGKGGGGGGHERCGEWDAGTPHLEGCQQPHQTTGADAHNNRGFGAMRAKRCSQPTHENHTHTHAHIYTHTSAPLFRPHRHPPTLVHPQPVAAHRHKGPAPPWQQAALQGGQVGGGWGQGMPIWEHRWRPAWLAPAWRPAWLAPGAVHRFTCSRQAAADVCACAHTPKFLPSEQNTVPF